MKQLFCVPAARYRISGKVLKIIAMITMFIDHFAYTMLEADFLPLIEDSVIGGRNLDYRTGDLQTVYISVLIMRSIGRLAFPIFVFLLVEGFLHTRNTYKYAARLAAFALISEVPFDIAISGKIIDITNQNVMFTLLLGLIMMFVIDRIERKKLHPAVYYFLTVIVFLITGFIAKYIYCDYSFLGISMIYACYMLRNRRSYMWLGCLMAMLISDISGLTVFSSMEFIALFAFIIINRYDGTPGKFRFRYAFYFFYPAHLLILGLLRVFIYNIYLF